VIDFDTREHHQHQLAEFGKEISYHRVVRDDLQGMRANHDPAASRPTTAGREMRRHSIGTTRMRKKARATRANGGKC